MSLGERADKDGCSGRSRCCWNRVTLSCIQTCCLWTVGRPRGLSACPLCLARRQSWEAKRSVRGRRFLKCFSQLQEKSYKYQTSIHQKYRIERVIIDLLWRWRCQQFYRRLFCNRSLWRKGFFGLFSNAGSQMSVGHSLDTQKSPRMTFSFWTVSAASSQFIRPHTDFSQTSRFSLVLRPPLYFILLKSLIIRRAFFSCRRSTRVTFYIHHKSDAAVAIFTLSPIIIVYRQ